MAEKKAKKQLTEKYQYSGEGELISDKPSTSLNRTKNKLTKKYSGEDKLISDKPFESLNRINEIKPIVKSNKELYESYIKELKNFSLSINNEIVYDSSIDKSGILPVKFGNDYFILYGKKYSYNGLKIQKIN